VDIQWVRQIEHLLHSGQRDGASSQVNEAAAAAPEDRYVLLSRSLVSSYGYHHDQSIAVAAAVLEAARAASDKVAEAKALCTQANALRRLGRREEALVAATAALEAARAAGDNLSQGDALQSQADALRMLGRYEESLGASTAALEVARSAGSKAGEGNAL